MSLLLLALTLQVRLCLKNKHRKAREVFSIQIYYLDYLIILISEASLRNWGKLS